MSGTLADGDEISSIKIEGEQVDAGVGTNVVKDAVIQNAVGTAEEHDVTDNYEIQYETGTLTVTKAIPEIKIISDTEELGKVYDKKPVDTPKFINTGDGEAKICYYDLTGGIKERLEGIPVNAGTYAVQVEAKAGRNYEAGVSAFEYFTIERRPVTLRAQDAKSVYGEKRSELSAAVTEGEICEGDDLEIGAETSATDRSNAGTYRILPTYKTNSNYVVTLEEAEYTIEKAVPTILVNSVTAVYNGMPQYPEVESTGEAMLFFSKADMIEAGTYEVTITSPESQNYEKAELTVTFEITEPDTPADSTIDRTEGSIPGTSADSMLTMEENRLELRPITGTVLIRPSEEKDLLLSLDLIPEEAVNEQSTYSYGKGEIQVIIEKVGAEEFDIAFDNAREVVSEVFDKEELRRIQNGEKAQIRFTVVANPENIPEADSTLIQQGLTNLRELYGEVVLDYNADVTLEKRVGDTEWNKIEQLSSGVNITLQLKRFYHTALTYFVIRAHAGKCNILRDMDTDSRTLTARLDRFSTYAICYTYKQMNLLEQHAANMTLTEEKPHFGSHKFETPQEDPNEEDRSDTLAYIINLMILLIFFGIIVTCIEKVVRKYHRR